jgi:hypothetical protein
MFFSFPLLYYNYSFIYLYKGYASYIHISRGYVKHKRLRNTALGNGHGSIVETIFSLTVDLTNPSLSFTQWSRFSLLSLFWNKKFWEELIAYIPWYDTGHIENDASNSLSTAECVLATAVTFLPSRCLTTIRGFLPSRCLTTIGGFYPAVA